MSDYDIYHSMQIEAWAERRNEATLYGTDDYPVQPNYCPKSAPTGKAKPKATSAEDAIAWLEKWTYKP